MIDNHPEGIVCSEKQENVPGGFHGNVPDIYDHTNMKHKFLFLCTALLMIVLGTSDAMRGIFSPLFRDGFGVSIERLGFIVSLSYVGNLSCLLVGGIILDKMGRRTAMILFMLLLATSEMLLLHGNLFFCLATGFFLTLGLSTLLNTTVNLISSEFSRSRKLLVVNTLFFIQGLGTAGSQLLFSRYASDRSVFNILLISMSVGLILFSVPFMSAKNFARKIPDQKGQGPSGTTDKTAIFLLTASLAFYLIAEHGVTNYLIVYGTEYLDVSAASVGTDLALFSAGIMTGRLLLAPLADRLGALRTMALALFLGALAYTTAFASAHLNLLFFAGFFVSLTYPSVIAVVSDYTSERSRSRTTTMVISMASVADVLFNLAFGKTVSDFGYPFAITLLCASLWIATLLMTILRIREKRKSALLHLIDDHRQMP